MTHADEARRITFEKQAEKIVAENRNHPLEVWTPREFGMMRKIAAVLAAAERRGWEAGRDAAAEVAERSGYIGGSVAVASAIRALLPAEPAAGCATCGGDGYITRDSDEGSDDAFGRIPCPSCSAGGGA